MDEQIQAVTNAGREDVEIDKIIIEDRGRTEFGDIVGLSISISTQGLINPILVYDLGNGTYRLLAGERRIKAYQHLNRTVIPARIVKFDNLDEHVMFDLELQENIWRLALAPDEEILLKSKINDRKLAQLGVRSATNPDGWNQKQTAKMFKESEANISRDIALAPILKAIPKELRSQCKTKGELRTMVEKLANNYINEKVATNLQEQHKDNPSEIERSRKKLVNSYLIQDYREMLKGLNDTSVGFVHCDSDYGTDINALAKKNPGKIIDPYVQFDPTKFREEFTVIATECYRVLRDDCWAVFWFGGQHQPVVYQVLSNVGFDVGIPLPWLWIKTKGQSNVPSRYPARTYETFAYVRKGKSKLYIRAAKDTITCEGVPGAVKRHRAEKPVELLFYILKIFSEPTDFVVDVFAGSGNMLLAAANRGNEVIGCDIVQQFKTDFTVAVYKQPYGEYSSFKTKPMSLPETQVMSEVLL